MNTNPNAKAILCYGDSNTYGQKPDRSGRYPADVRWPGVLQQKLGDDYYIVEEGLGGRTTDLEHYNPDKPSRNGFTYYKACLDSHTPLEVVAIMLGTNDFKLMYHRNPRDIADALRQYVAYTRHFFENMDTQQPKILLISPPYMDETAEAFEASMPTPGIYDATSAQKTKELAPFIKELADETGCEFFDAATVTETGVDGCHLDEVSHKKLGEALALQIRA